MVVGGWSVVMLIPRGWLVGDDGDSSCSHTLDAQRGRWILSQAFHVELCAQVFLFFSS